MCERRVDFGGYIRLQKRAIVEAATAAKSNLSMTSDLIHIWYTGWYMYNCTYLLGSWTLQYNVFLLSFYLIRVSNKFLVVPWLYFQDNLRTTHAFKKPENFCISKLQEIAVRDHSVPTCLYVQYNVLYYLPSLLRSDTVPKQIKECIRKGCTLGTSYRKEFFLLQQSENFLKVPRFNTNIL